MEKHLRWDRETPPSKHCISLLSLKLHSRWGARVLMTLCMTLRCSCGWFSSLTLILRWYWWGRAVQSRFRPKLLSAFWLMTCADWLWRTKLPLNSTCYAPLHHLRQQLNGKMAVDGGKCFEYLTNKIIQGKHAKQQNIWKKNTPTRVGNWEQVHHFFLNNFHDDWFWFY